MNFRLTNRRFPFRSLTTPMLFFLLSWITTFACLHSYDVYFHGIDNPEVLTFIRSVSQLEKLKKSPPSTLLGLKRRAHNDEETIIQALHSLGYYEAKMSFEIKDNGQIVQVNFTPGPVYHFSKSTIHYFQDGQEIEKHDFPSPQCLHLKEGDVALPETIVDAEDMLLDKLNLKGYAFATVKKRDVVAEPNTHKVSVEFEVETGPKTYFGALNIKGLERVSDCYLMKKLKWKEGDLYDPSKLEKYQESLELSGLFRSINITHPEKPSEGDTFPLEINVIEAKQRSVSIGVNYTTELGPGLVAEWEDRNIQGNGEKLSAKLDLWVKLQNGKLTYLTPDYLRQDQNLIWDLDYHYERNKAFTEKALSLSRIIERKLNEKLRFSYGLMYKILRSQRSDRNGTFDLIKTPIQLRWSDTDSLLDPTRGMVFQFKTIPSLQIRTPQFAYCINTLTFSYYYPLTADKKHIFAAKTMLGSIFGGSKHDIPAPERFYAGSESALRGYRYLTVCPLGRDHKPLGGRSLMIFSFELRNRIWDNFGWTLFYEFGNVYANPIPEFDQPIRQSAGLGLRYHTPVGPIRLDFAIPMNRRKHLDRALEVYFSIGQSF